MPVGGGCYGLRDGDQKTRAPQQGDKTSQRLERCSVQQMNSISQRFDERIDHVFHRFNERCRKFEERLDACHRKQSDNRSPWVNMAHGNPIGKLVPVCRQHVYEEYSKRSDEEAPEFIRHQQYEGERKNENMNIGYVTQHQLFHTRCTINGKVCNLIIDREKEENIIGRNIVDKLQLPVETHPNPYSIGWMNVGEKVHVTKRCKVQFSIGKYKDEVYCDVVDVNCRLLFGKSWQYGVNAQHFEKDNTYKLKKEGVRYTLIPLRINNCPNTSKVKGQSNISKMHSEERVEVVMKESKDVCDMGVKQTLKVDEKLESSHEDNIYEEHETKVEQEDSIVDVKNINNSEFGVTTIVNESFQQNEDGESVQVNPLILELSNNKFEKIDDMKLSKFFDPIDDYLEELIGSKLFGCITNFCLEEGETEFFNFSALFVFFEMMIYAKFYGNKIRIAAREIIIWKRVRMKIAESGKIFSKTRGRVFFKWRRMTRSR